jgi:integrase
VLATRLRGRGKGGGCGHRVDIRSEGLLYGGVAVARERDLRAVRRPGRPHVVARMIGEVGVAATVAVHPPAAAALRRWRKQQTAEQVLLGPAWKTDGGIGTPGLWIVTEPDGGVVHPETLRRRWRAAARRAGVPEIPFHGARHSYATLALSAGVRLDVVSRQLGHSSISTTADIYTHDDDEAAAEGAARIAAAFPNAGSEGDS